MQPAVAFPSQSPGQRHEPAPGGLTSVAAFARLQTDGPNAMPDTSANLLQSALSKFWAPVPWLLEAAILLQLL